MDFGNTNPFMHIYREMLDKIRDQYLYHTGKKEYRTISALLQRPEESGITYSTIDDILSQDSRLFLDRIKNTALSIAYRIKIHKDIDYLLGYNWYTAKKDLLFMENLYPARDRGSERRRSMLTSDLFRIYHKMLDEEVNCWKDLQEPMRYFINLFHQYKGLKQDRKLLEEK